MKKNNTKSLLLGTGILILVVILMSYLYSSYKAKPDPFEGTKHIVAEVILTDGSSKSYEIQTTADYLREALESMDLIKGSESEYGLYVTTVDNVTVNDANQEWWNFTLNGNALNTGVDSTPINDGDHFEITLTKGY